MTSSSVSTGGGELGEDGVRIVLWEFRGGNFAVEIEARGRGLGRTIGRALAQLSPNR
jgi:hypothetical protein